MTKPTVFALLGLALAITLASPSRASAGVVIGVGIGPVYAPPAYGYVVVHPRPYFYPRPYVYTPGYVYPAYGYYSHDRDWRWQHRERDWDHGDRDFRGDRWHGDRR
jgi:hypothetical protein